MVPIGFETILFLSIGAIIGHVVGKLAKALAALMILLLALSLLGMAFLNLDCSSVVGAFKPLVKALIDLAKSRVEILIGFVLGLLVGIAR